MTIVGTSVRPRCLTTAALKRANIGEDYWRVDFSTYKGPVDALKASAQYLNELEQNKAKGVGILYAGKPGTGKTTLMAIVLKYLARANWTVHMTSLSELVELIKRSWDDKVLVNRIDHCKHVDFLGLDDLGKEHAGPTGFSAVTFDNLLRFRTQHRLPTLFTTNLDRKEILGRYGESTLSLIEGKTRVVPVQGKDYRQDEARRLK